MEAEERSSRAFYFVLAVALTIAVTTMLSMLPGRLSPPWLTGSGSTLVLWPQGWSFFDKVSEQHVIAAYRTGNGGPDAFPAATWIQMSDADGWGLSRVAFMQVIETKNLVAQVPGDGWTACGTEARQACMTRAAAGPYAAVSNEAGNPTLCGNLLLSDQLPVAGGDFSPTRVAAVEATCEAR